MSRQRFDFPHEAYFHALNPEHGIFNASTSQQGAGIGGLCTKIFRVVVPVVKRYVLPHIQTVASDTIKRVVSGRGTVREALQEGKSQFVSSIKKEANKLFVNRVQQGQGIARKCRSSVVQSVKPQKPRKRKSKPATKSNNKNIKKTKFDFLS